jgi:hypothetical protein
MENAKLIEKAQILISNIMGYNDQLEELALEPEVKESITIFEIDRIMMENDKQIRLFNKLIEKWSK